MTIDQKILDDLSAKAKASPRLRINLDMRNSDNDSSQRMFNAIEPGSELPIHRHPATSESCIVIRGAAEEIFYDNDGNITERVLMKANSSCIGVSIDAGRWHTLVSLEPGTIIFEAKDGHYEPLSSEDILTL